MLERINSKYEKPIWGTFLLEKRVAMFGKGGIVEGGVGG